MEKTLFTSISLHELESKFAQIVEDKIKNLLIENSKRDDTKREEYITREEISKRLKISLPTLNTLTKEGTLVGYRIGRRVLYKWCEVEEILHKITSTKYRRKNLL